MGSLGYQEIVLVLIVALIVFGPKKLPEMGKMLGRGIAEFKKASDELKNTWEEEVKVDKEKSTITAIPEQPKDIIKNPEPGIEEPSKLPNQTNS